MNEKIQEYKEQKAQLRRYKKRMMKELVKKSMDELGGFEASLKGLSRSLSEPLERFDITISPQVIWTWEDGKSLPYPLLFKVLRCVAKDGSLPKRFAERVLEILALEETPAQAKIRELGYDA